MCDHPRTCRTCLIKTTCVVPLMQFPSRPAKVFVENRVQVIRKFSNPNDWFSWESIESGLISDLSSDLMKINDEAFQWKMRFNLDPKKQAQEVIFSRKINKIDHPPLYFNENLVKSSSTQKHLGMILDTKLDFSLHLKIVQNKVNKK